MANGEIKLQLFLLLHRGDRVVHAHDLVVTGNDLPHAADATVIKEHEVFDDVEQAMLGEHAIQQRHSIKSGCVILTVALPLGEVIPLAGDGAVSSFVTIADDEKRVVMEGVRDTVFVQIVGQVFVETAADILVYCLQFDEHQRQPIDETDQVCTAIVVRNAHTLHLQFTDGKKAVVVYAIRREIEYACGCRLPFASQRAPMHLNAITDHSVEVAILLHAGASEVDAGELIDGLLAGVCGNRRIEPRERRAQITHEDHITLGLASKRAGRAERFRVERIHGFPPQSVAQVVRERLLNQPVFGVNVRQRHADSARAIGTVLAQLWSICHETIAV